MPWEVKMVSAAGTIIRTVPTFQALAIAGDNIGFATSKKKKTAKSFVKQGVKNVVGISLIPPTAQLAGLVP